jgi:predicted DNA-binding protein
MSHRTQIYLTDEQRARLDELARRKDITLAEAIRRAVDAYLELGDDLDAAYGAAPGIRVTIPTRDEWDRG